MSATHEIGLILKSKIKGAVDVQIVGRDGNQVLVTPVAEFAGVYPLSTAEVATLYGVELSENLAASEGSQEVVDGYLALAEAHEEIRLAQLREQVDTRPTPEQVFDSLRDD